MNFGRLINKVVTRILIFYDPHDLLSDARAVALPCG